MRWSKPVEGFFKINFDGFFLPSGETTADFIIRDHEGATMVCGGVQCGLNSALAAKAVALKEGIIKAKALGLSNIVIEGDNLIVINCLRKLWKCSWDIEILISDIHFLLQHFGGVQLNHVFQEVNTVADKIADLLHFVPPQDLLADLHMRVLIRKDALGWWSSRV